MLHENEINKFDPDEILSLGEVAEKKIENDIVNDTAGLYRSSKEELLKIIQGLEDNYQIDLIEAGKDRSDTISIVQENELVSSAKRDSVIEILSRKLSDEELETLDEKMREKVAESMKNTAGESLPLDYQNYLACDKAGNEKEKVKILILQMAKGALPLPFHKEK